LSTRAFTGDDVSFTGTHYRLDHARNLPRPVQAGGPKILIGGGGEKWTLRWWPVTRTSATSRAQNTAEVHEMLAAAGSAEEIAGFTVGQPHEIPGLVEAHIAAGADEVIFSFAFRRHRGNHRGGGGIRAARTLAAHFDAAKKAFGLRPAPVSCAESAVVSHGAIRDPALGVANPVPGGSSCCGIKIEVSGRSSGNRAREGLPGTCGRWRALAFRLVNRHYLRQLNTADVHGKEKVYGSIPQGGSTKSQVRAPFPGSWQSIQDRPTVS
jgi:hypothetical protein